SVVLCLCFFFQAEDGIRDPLVTGVQTCALPIWVEYCNGKADSRYGSMRVANGHPEPFEVKYWEIGNEIWGDWVRGHTGADTYAQIGRASCRERGWMRGAAVLGKEHERRRDEKER